MGMNEHTVIDQAKAARNASLRTAGLSEELRNKAIRLAAEKIDSARKEILAENKKDQEAGQDLNYSLMKRLILNDKKIDGIINSLKDVAKLPDPIGITQTERELDKDLILTKVSVPIGVIGVIFESRPDALVQISSLCLKSGNAVILKGGKEALHTNRILHKLIVEAAVETDKEFSGTVQMVETREDIRALLDLDEYIDLMIPRGSNELVRTIQENTKIPVLGHADGICHLFIDRDADEDMAVAITRDSKTQYPAVCNAIETLLVHQSAAESILPKIRASLQDVQLLGDKRTRDIIPVEEAREEDWKTEYNDMVLSIKVVHSLEEAIGHINTYGSGHTDSIVTANKQSAERFLQQVDSSSVIWNASTRFADGFRYGLGAEVGISTNKIHARGPVGLEGLTIYKYVVTGTGQIVADYASGQKTFTHRDIHRD